MNSLSGAAKTRLVVQVVGCLLILGMGRGIMKKLSSMKKPPKGAPVQEQVLRVECLTVTKEDLPVKIQGFGEVRTLNVVRLAPEVAGRVVQVHPKLEVGEIVPAGEPLFQIDDRDYKAALEEAKAQVAQFQTTVERLSKQYALDRERLKTLERNKDLAKAEYERRKELFEEDEVGTRSGVEGAEQAFNSASDLYDQLARAVELYPIQIKEAESSLKSAEARAYRAEVNLSRCSVSVPFDARVKETELEAGQYVTPGVQVMTLADDSVLEIHVPLDSADARKWLRFRAKKETEEGAWFNWLEQVDCAIRWTEDPEGHVWTGVLDRVVRFEEETRTVTVAVRIMADNALSQDVDELPLVEGLFCAVEIPGRTLPDVAELPQWAVSLESTVYLAVDGRLKTVPVTVARTEGDSAYVSSGLEEGDTVITTRLVEPLEGTLVDVSLAEGDAA